MTSTSGLSPKPTPTTPPVAPWPADTDAAATGSGPGEFRGPGGDPLPADDPFEPDGFDGPGAWEPEDGESEAAERPLPDGVVDAEAAVRADAPADAGRAARVRLLPAAPVAGVDTAVEDGAPTGPPAVAPAAAAA